MAIGMLVSPKFINGLYCYRYNDNMNRAGHFVKLMTLSFFKGLRYVFTFAAVFQPAWASMQGQNVSFLLIFHNVINLSKSLCSEKNR